MIVKSILVYFLIIAYISFALISGYQGDVEYYIEVDDGSIRNFLVGAVVKALFFLYKSVYFVIYIWAFCFFTILLLYKKIIPLNFYLCLIPLFPFVVIPSKEGLALVFIVIAFSCLKKISNISYLTLLMGVCLLRPFFLIFVILSLIVNLNKRLVFFVIIVFLILFCTLVFIPINNPLLDGYYSYAVGYFVGATEAGATDWDFVNGFNDLSLINKITSVSLRSLFPVWMIGKSFNQMAYFIIYSAILLYSWYMLNYLSIILKYNYHKLFSFLLLLSVVLVSSPLLVSNAGSSVRYISILPFLIMLIIARTKSVLLSRS